MHRHSRRAIAMDIHRPEVMTGLINNWGKCRPTAKPFAPSHRPPPPGFSSGLYIIIKRIFCSDNIAARIVNQRTRRADKVFTPQPLLYFTRRRRATRDPCVIPPFPLNHPERAGKGSPQVITLPVNPLTPGRQVLPTINNDQVTCNKNTSSLREQSDVCGRLFI